MEIFLSLSSQGPTLVCVCCHRCMYERSVHKFHKDKFKYDSVGKIHISSNLNVICKTCHVTMKRGKLPAQTVVNKLEIFEPPELIKNMNRLEHVLISRRILFKKVSIMPKGNFPKMKGSICNIPL